MIINGKELDDILKDHKLWLDGEGGERADLYGANLYGANLSRANLSEAKLYGASLSRANLSEANLYGADLSRANLSRANLSEANLYGANLSRANLSEANLYGASLWGCAGDRDYIKSLFISDDYPITYTATHLQIGCERHEIKDWWGFDDDIISGMDGDTALIFWKEWKDTIKMIIEKSPASSTGYMAPTAN